MSRKLMKLRLCYCCVICHSVLDDITGPACGESTGHQSIPVARFHWSAVLVVQRAAIPSPEDSPHKRWLDVFFHVCLSELLKKRSIVASELKSHDAYAMSLLCVIVNSAFRMVEHQDNNIATIFKIENKQITCDHGCVELDWWFMILDIFVDF